MIIIRTIINSKNESNKSIDNIKNTVLRINIREINC